MEPVSTTDIRAVLAAADDLLPARDSDQLPVRILETVAALVDCDFLTYNAVDLSTGSATIHSTGPAPEPQAAHDFAAHAIENPALAHQQLTRDLTPVRISDFITTRQFRRRAIYELVYRPLGVEFQLALGVAVGPDQVVGIALNRGQHDFSARDVAVLELLRPLLHQIHLSSSAHVRDGATRSRLTARQREVLALLAGGASNAMIAGRLHVSEKTVAKHLEHIYRELGVRNRTSAAARWRSMNT